MKVHELIKKLQQCPQDDEVQVGVVGFMQPFTGHTIIRLDDNDDIKQLTFVTDDGEGHTV